MLVIYLFSPMFVNRAVAFFPGWGYLRAGLTSLSLFFLGAKTSEEQVTPTRGRSRKEKAEGSREALKDKRSSGRSKKHPQGPGMGAPPPRPPEADQSSVDMGPPPGKPLR